MQCLFNRRLKSAGQGQLLILEQVSTLDGHLCAQPENIPFRSRQPDSKKMIRRIPGCVVAYRGELILLMTMSRSPSRSRSA